MNRSRCQFRRSTGAGAALCLAAALALALALPAMAAVNAWSARGPAQVLNHLAADPHAPGRLFAASVDGLYRTENGGQTWERLPQSLLGHNVLSLAVDAAQEGRLYAGTNLGLYTSADGGASWSPVESVGSGILSLATGPAGSGAVYAGTFGRGVYISRDSGATWTQSGPQESGIVFDLATTTLDAGAVYAGTSDGLFASTDGGDSWTRLGEALDGKSVRAVYLSPALEEADLLVVGTYGAGVLRSADGGQTWVSVSTGLSPLKVRDLAVVDSTFAGTMYAATSTGGFFRTKDGGQQWLPINAGLTSLASRSVLISPSDKDLVLGTGLGEGMWEMRFAPEPQIRLTPASIDFGPVPLGSTSTRTLTVVNVGTADLVVTGVSLGAAAGFSVDFDGPVALAAGEALAMDVAFAPAVRDVPLSDLLAVASNDPDEPTVVVELSGTGTRSTLTAVPGDIAFGEVPIPPGFAHTTLILRNTGSASLALLSAAVDNSRFQIHDFVAQVLGPGQSVSLRLSFAPVLPRPETATLRLVSDSEPDTLALRISGTGTAPDVRVSETFLDFGRVDLSSRRELPLAITNSGSAWLTISEVGAATGQFSVDRGLGNRDTVLVVTEPDTLRIVAGGDTTLVFTGADTTRVLVGPKVTRIVADGDTTTTIQTDGDTTLVLVGREVQTVVVLPDTTLVAPGQTVSVDVAFHPTTSGGLVDTLSIVSDAPIAFGLTHVVLRGEGNALSLEPIPGIDIGEYPVDVAVADLDGANGVDLVLADSLSGQVHVLLNEGGGTYPATGRRTYPGLASAYGPWVAPVAVAMAPIYGTTMADLIVGDRVARSVSVVRNSGTGTFDGERQDIFIGHQLSDVATADLDADGDRDIIVANGPGSDSVTLLFNDGAGGFEARAVVAVQSGPVAIAAGNLNPDGYSDLVVVNRGSNSVSVLLNNRLGGFSQVTHLATGAEPVAVAMADYDGDGDLDIAVANAATRNISLFANNGEGQFTAGPTLGTGLRPHDVALGAVSADIYNDVVAAGSSSYLVFLESQDGVNFDRQDLTADLVPRRVRIADVDGNRVSDIVVVGAAAGRVQIYRNGLAERQMRPQPPVRVSASDVTGDLGGSILVTWEDGDYGTQPPEDQVIRTTLYTIARSVSAEFTDPDTLGSVPGGAFQFVDETATPYQTFYYQVTARRDSLSSAPSAAAMAVSLPAPLVDLRVVNGPRVSVGDTMVVQAYVTPAQSDLVGLSLFISYDTGDLALVADSSVASAPPFRVALPGFSTVSNAVHDTSAPGCLDLTLISPPGAPALSAGVEPVLVGEVWFKAERDAITRLTVDNEPQRNRSTAVVESGTGQWLLPVLGDTIRVSVRDYQVTGQLRLESRDPALSENQATVLFIGQSGDTLESPINDEDRLRTGIQITLDDSGRFQFAQIPRGTYRIFAKAPTHLQGRLVADTVAIDTTGHDLTFKWLPPTGAAFAAPADSAVLPAGDANDDNRINLADFGLLVRYFGANSSSPTWRQARAADFDGRDGVSFDDFWLLADNFGQVGMEVVAAARPAPDPVTLLADPVTGLISLADPARILGFAVSTFDAGLDVDLSQTLWPDGALVVHRWVREGETHIVGALVDPAQAITGSGALLRLRDAGVGTSMPRIELLDDECRARPVRFVSALPLSASLGANYPNPFNPATTIPFTVPSGSPAVIGDQAGGGSAAHVRLEIYDLLGQRVRVLVDGALTAGEHWAVWDGRDARGERAASGPYFYRLEIGAFEQTCRLLLLR